MCLYFLSASLYYFLVRYSTNTYSQVWDKDGCKTVWLQHVQVRVTMLRWVTRAGSEALDDMTNVRAGMYKHDMVQSDTAM